MKAWLGMAVLTGIGSGFLLAAFDPLGLRDDAIRGVMFGVFVATVSNARQLRRRLGSRSAKPL